MEVLQDPGPQKDALRRLEGLLGSGEIRDEHFAYLHDRLAVAARRPQRPWPSTASGWPGCTAAGRERSLPLPAR